MYQVGYDKAVLWNGVACATTGYDSKKGGDLPEVTNTSTDGIQGLLAGVRRNSGTGRFVFQPGDASDGGAIDFGNSGTITIQTGGSPISYTARIESVGHKSEVNGVVSVEFSWKESVT